MSLTHRKTLAKYALVGTINTAIYSLLLWFFLGVEYFPYPFAIAFAFCLAMVFQYLANKYFTFGIAEKSLGEVFRYLTGAGINYSLSVLTVWLCLDVIQTSNLLASILSALIAAVVGYFVSFFWIYKNEN